MMSSFGHYFEEAKDSLSNRFALIPDYGLGPKNLGLMFNHGRQIQGSYFQNLLAGKPCVSKVLLSSFKLNKILGFIINGIIELKNY